MATKNDKSKMKALFSFVLLFSSDVVMAQNDDFHIWAEFVNRVNSGEMEPSPFREFRCQADGTAIPASDYQENLAQQCAIDLCGIPKDSPSAALLNYNFDQYVQEGAMARFAEIEPKIREAIESEFNRNAQFLEALEEKMKDGGLEPDYATWEGQDYEAYTWQLFNRYIEFETDKTKPFDERISFKINLPSDSSDIFKKGIEQYTESKKSKIESDFTEGLYYNFYTIEEAKEILLEKWKEFNDRYQENKKSNPHFMIWREDDYNVLANKIQNFQSEDLYDVIPIAFELSRLNDELIFQETGNNPSQSPTSLCSHEDCQKAIQEKISSQDLRALFNDLKAANAEKNKRTEERVAYCKSELAMKSLKDYEISEFEKIIPEVKTAFMERVFEGYSEDSKRNFSSYLENELNFSTLTRTEDVQGYIDQINKNYEHFKGNRNRSGNYQYYNTKIFVHQLLSYKDNFHGKVDPLKGMDLCGYGLSKVVTDGFIPQEGLEDWGKIDSFDPEKDNVVVSLFSCTHHSFGKSILAHELGHALSYAFFRNKLSIESYGKFMELRQCANTLYKVDKNEKTPPLFKHDGDFYKTEEDMADLIAFLANPDTSVLYECPMLVPSPSGEFYTDLELSSKNSIETSKHSTPLLRVLQEAIHKRKSIPSACQELMDNNEDKYRFTPCF